MYLGLLLWLTGFALYLGSVTPFVALPLFVWVLNTQQIVHEERVLEARFGDSYRDYRTRVRRWI
jgi:protein-S-isoprenylcysteine O-methyltransferase Ste14